MTMLIAARGASLLHHGACYTLTLLTEEITPEAVNKLRVSESVVLGGDDERDLRRKKGRGGRGDAQTVCDVIPRHNQHVMRGQC